MSKKVHAVIALLIVLALPVRGFASAGITGGCGHLHHENHASTAGITNVNHGLYAEAVEHVDHDHADGSHKGCDDKCACGTCACCVSSGAFILQDTKISLPADGGLIYAATTDFYSNSVTPESLLRPPSVFRLA